jgi:hypothetical protein
MADTKDKETTGPNPGPLDMREMPQGEGQLGVSEIVTPDMLDNLKARGVILPTDWSQYPAAPELADRDQSKIKGMLPAISQMVGHEVKIEEVMDANPRTGKWVLKDGSSYLRYRLVS